MQKVTPFSLILCLILSACSAAHADEETLHRLDNAAWPTPRPTAAQPTSTPFPKISLADLATPTPIKSSSEESEKFFGSVTEVESRMIMTPTNIPASHPAAALTPVATAHPVAQARVQSEALNVRRGPGPVYDPIGILKQNDTVAILGVNPTRDWALVRSANPGQGWVSLAYLTVDGSLDNIPTMEIGDREIKSPQPSAALTQTASWQNGESVNISPQSPIVNRQPLFLQEVAKAYLLHPAADIRPAPSTADAPIDTISDDQTEIAVLAVDQSRQWALVNPAHAHPGWMALADLAINGDLAAAPVAITAWTNSNELTLRAAPGIYADAVGAMPINNLVRVLGLSEGRNWALVQPLLGSGQGWLSLNFLTLHTPAAKLPVVKDENKSLVSTHNVQSPISTQSVQPLNAHLVFQLASGGDIMVVNPDGTGLRRLTSGLDPALSPDGQTVAFTRWQGETGSLWTINVDGANEHQVAGFIKQAKGPAWSPDGSQIVLNFQHGGRLESKTECADVLKNPNPAIPWNGDIHTDRNGDPKVKIQFDGGVVKGLVCWDLLPDPHWSLKVVNLADGHTEDLDGGTYAFRPTWDPAQPWRIISAGGMGLVETDLTQKTSRRLTEEIGDSTPVFSPDGRYLLVTTPSGGGMDIYRLNRDGSGRVRLTKTPLWVTAMPGQPKPWHNVSPTWSPDGNQIAFLTDRSGQWEIWLMNAECASPSEGCDSNPQPMFSDEALKGLTISYAGVNEAMLAWR